MSDHEVDKIVRDVNFDVRPRLILRGWSCSVEGADGLGRWTKPGVLCASQGLVHSIARELDGDVWSHLSLSRSDKKMPSWYELRDAFRLVHPTAYGIVVVPPLDKHVSIAEVSHIWTNLTSPAFVPDFTRGGMLI